jgi:hypothetical protein
MKYDEIILDLKYKNTNQMKWIPTWNGIVYIEKNLHKFIITNIKNLEKFLNLNCNSKYHYLNVDCIVTFFNLKGMMVIIQHHFLNQSLNI